MALALASRIRGSFVTYSPTVHNGMVIVGNSDASSGLLKELQDADADQLSEVGRRLGTEWVRRQLKEPDDLGRVRGGLLAQGVSERPEWMLEAIAGLTTTDMARGLTRLRFEGAVTVVGGQ
jgi:hypothetical protein